MNYRETIPNLIGGVSQQPKWIRFDNQVEEMVNGLVSVTDGLLDRPPFRHVSTLKTSALTDPHVHWIKKDNTDRYAVVATDTSLEVWGLDGTSKTVNIPGGTNPTAYLNTGGSPKTKLHMETVGDTTFILNKTKTVADSGNNTTTSEASALAWVTTGQSNTKYTVTLSYTLSGSPVTSVATYTTPSTPETNWRTDYIIAQLVADFSADTNFTNEFTVSAQGSVLKVDKKPASLAEDWSLSFEDGLGNNAIKVFNQETGLFEELPPGAPEGTVIKVTGDGDNDFKPFFVKFREGAWEETIAPDEADGFDETTMPQVLVLESDGTFTFKPHTWTKRTVGDLETNPFPSFVGQKIEDIFFVRDRMGFLAGSNVIMSRTRYYEDFFRLTIQTRLADDPIDVQIRSNKVSNLNHAVPFNETLLVFSQTAQFQLGKAEILTQETAAFNPTTEYAADPGAKPQGTGRDIYFLTPSGSKTAVQEYRVFADIEAQEATEVTKHVPRYVDAGVFQIEANPADGTLVLLNTNRRNIMHVYRQYSQSGTKVVSAWSSWEREAEAEIEGVFFDNSKLYAVVQYTDNSHVCLEELDLDLARTDDGYPWQLRLDRMVEFANGDGTYDPGTDTTSFTLPGSMTVSTPADWSAMSGSGDGTAGQDLTIFSIVGSTLKLTGDWSAQHVLFGRKFEFRTDLTEIILKENKEGGGAVPFNEARLNLQYMELLLSTSGYLRAEVNMSAGRSYSYVFTGYKLGSPLSLIGEVPNETMGFRFPIRAKSKDTNISLINDTAFPCQILGGKWEGRIYARATMRRPQ